LAVSGAQTSHVIAEGVTAVVILAAIRTRFAYVLNYQIITSEGATVASTVTYLLPVVAIVLGAVLVMAALAICAVTAAQLRDRTGTETPPPARPDAPPPADPGLIPLTVREIRRLLAAALDQPKPPGHAARGSNGDAATRRDHAGFTNAHAWRATMPWSDSNWMLPYQ
jgi:hypothetical protein